MSGQAPKPKKPATTYEIQYDESGAMRRVPVQPSLIPLPPAQPRTSIVSSAVAQQVNQRPAEEVEENVLVFDNEGEVTGEARQQAIQQAEQKEDDDVIVFDEEGEVTGEERQRILAEQEAKAKAEGERKNRKPTKNAKSFAELNNVEKMKFFYRLRAKHPFFYIYTDKGNLQIRPHNPSSIPPATIPLRAFSALKPEELEEIETKQKEEQEKIEQQYVLKMKELRAANDLYEAGNKESILNIVKLNQELREVSVLRNKILYPERWTSVLDNPSTNEILLNQPKEERKMGFEVYVFKRFGLKKEDALGHYREHGEFTAGVMKGGETMVIFITRPDDQETGSFHPITEKEFVYNETKYVSPYQAFETERFKELDDEGIVKKLLGTRSAKTIREIASKEPKQVAHPLKLWEEILEAYYTQFKEAAEKLKATGSARFHMMDKLFGSPDYANALANVRTKLKERENDAAPLADSIKQSVISEDEQKKAKVGAIINNFRRG